MDCINSKVHFFSKPVTNKQHTTDNPIPIHLLCVCPPCMNYEINFRLLLITFTYRTKHKRKKISPFLIIFHNIKLLLSPAAARSSTSPLQHGQNIYYVSLPYIKMGMHMNQPKPNQTKPNRYYYLFLKGEKRIIVYQFIPNLIVSFRFIFCFALFSFCMNNITKSVCVRCACLYDGDGDFIYA